MSELLRNFRRFVCWCLASSLRSSACLSTRLTCIFCACARVCELCVRVSACCKRKVYVCARTRIACKPARTRLCVRVCLRVSFPTHTFLCVRGHIHIYLHTLTEIYARTYKNLQPVTHIDTCRTGRERKREEERETSLFSIKNLRVCPSGRAHMYAMKFFSLCVNPHHVSGGRRVTQPTPSFIIIITGARLSHSSRSRHTSAYISPLHHHEGDLPASVRALVKKAGAGTFSSLNHRSSSSNISGLSGTVTSPNSSSDLILSQSHT